MRASAASRQAVVVRDVLEGMLVGLARGSGLRKRSLARALESALESTHELATSSPSDARHFELVDRCLHEVHRVQVIAEEEDGGRHAKLGRRARMAAVALASAREATLDAIVEGAPDLAPSVDVGETDLASDGEPRSRVLPREVLPTMVRVVDIDAASASEQPLIDSLASELGDLAWKPDETGVVEDDDLIDRLQILGTPHASDPDVCRPGLRGELAFLRRTLRTCLEDIGAAYLMRWPASSDDHHLDDTARIEARLVANLDACWSLSTPFFLTRGEGARYRRFDVCREALAWERDALTPDPLRAFATTLLLTSVEGEDTVRAAVLTLRTSSRLTWRARADALALAPSEAVDRAMMRLLGAEDDALIGLALEVLARRRLASTGPVIPLLEHHDADLRAAAVRCLGSSGDPTVVPLLVEILETEIEDSVLISAVEALFRIDALRAVAWTRHELSEEEGVGHALFGTLARVLAFAGEAADVERLASHLEWAPSMAEMLGFHGFPGHVDTILTALETRRIDPRRARRALFLITGEHFDDAASAATWWRAHRERFSAARRYRLGHEITDASLAAALLGPQLHLDEHDAGVLELCGRASLRAPARGWVGPLQRQLERIRDGSGA